MQSKKILCWLLSIVCLLSAMSSLFVVANADDKGYSWAGSWSTSPIKTGVTLNGVRLCDFLTNSSYRTVVQCTLGGEKVRLKFSNRYGDAAVTINETNIARTSTLDDASIIEGSVLPVTFGGAATITIPAGKEIYSDPINMKVSALEKISITSYIKSFTYITTAGFYGGTSYVESGNKLTEIAYNKAAPLLFSSGAITYHTIPFLCNLDVYAKDAYSIVIIGDSTVTNQAPYYLAEKLVKSGVNNVGVLQQAIVANRLLYSGEGVSIVGNIYGDSCLNRFEADALKQAGVKKIFVKIGVNDVIHPRCNSMKGIAPLATTEEIIDGYKALISRAHEAGLEIYFFSRTAWRGYSRNFALTKSDVPDVVWSQDAEDILLACNNWLKSSFSGVDGYIDLDSMRDPYDERQLLPAYTTDGAHFSDLGARILVDLIPLRYIGISESKNVSIVKLYEDGKGGEQVTTPFTPIKSQPVTQKPDTPASSNTPTTKPEAPTNAPTIINVPTVLVTAPKPDTTKAPSAPNAENISKVVNELVKPEPLAELDTRTKVGVAILTMLSVAMLAVVAVYFVNKRRLSD